MKICAIRGSGLASFAHPFSLELDQAPLAQCGLFSITGPTGAGKSTLLDALCLALFDRVPRLDANSGSAVEGLKAQDPRQLLRKGSAEGWAEVEFTNSQKERFRCRWSVRRARLSVEGKLQPQEMTLLDLERDLRIGRTKREVLHEIESRLGLSYSQFRRSVLLAQGDFAAFLSASERERSELLERITGTEIYTKVSMLAHEQASLYQVELKQLQQRLADIGPPDKTELPLKETAQRLEQSKTTLAKLLKQQEVATERTRWQQAIEKIRVRLKQIASNEKEDEDLLQTLATLSLARPLHPLHLTIQQRKESQKVAQRELTKLTNTLDSIEKELTQLEAEIREGEAAVHKLSALREVAVEINELKQAEAQHRKKLSELNQRKTKQEKQQSSLQKEQREQLVVLQELEQELLLRQQGESLASLRAELHEGAPCPLCGSEEHPWAEEGTLRTVEQRNKINATKKQLNLLTKKQAEIEADQQHLSQEQQECRQRIETISNRLLELREKWNNGEPDREWEAQLAIALQLPHSLEVQNAKETSTQTPTIVKRLDTIKKARIARDRDRASLLGQQKKTEQDLNALRKALESERQKLSSGLSERSLTAEQVEAAWALSPDWEPNQRQRIEKLQSEKERCLGQLEECETRLLELKNGDSSEANLDQLRESIQNAKSEVARLEKENQALHTQLELRNERTRQRQDLEKRQAGLLKKSATSEALRELIGSRDGHKFRKFAQGLTLESLLHATNDHLNEIAPRYRIEKHPESDLGLLIIDQEMGDEARTTETLSGGESFLVSLGLALGLSSLSSDQSQIESLFIDEGFGTLDQGNLDLALDMLDQLQAMGRKIAVISHLPSLIERLDTTVRVVPSLSSGSRLQIEQGALAM